MTDRERLMEAAEWYEERNVALDEAMPILTDPVLKEENAKRQKFYRLASRILRQVAEAETREVECADCGHTESGHGGMGCRACPCRAFVRLELIPRPRIEEECAPS